MIKLDHIIINCFNTESKSKVIGMKSGNKAQLLLGLTIFLSFSYFYIVSGIQTTWALTLGETIAVGQSPIALAFHPSNDNLYVDTETSGNVSVIDP